jgi:hypothetical protein
LDVEFRGAAFTVGGDATIDGLVTFPSVFSVLWALEDLKIFRHFIRIQSTS